MVLLCTYIATSPPRTSTKTSIKTLIRTQPHSWGLTTSLHWALTTSNLYRTSSRSLSKLTTSHSTSEWPIFLTTMWGRLMITITMDKYKLIRMSSINTRSCNKRDLRMGRWRSATNSPITNIRRRWTYLIICLRKGILILISNNTKRTLMNLMMFLIWRSSIRGWVSKKTKFNRSPLKMISLRGSKCKVLSRKGFPPLTRRGWQV